MIHSHVRALAGLVTVTAAGVLLSVYWSAGSGGLAAHRPVRIWKCQTCGSAGSKLAEGSLRKESLLLEAEKSLLTQSDHELLSCNGQNTTKTEDRHGFIGPFDYIVTSKNPCWNDTSYISHAHQLHCLPYFFLAGVSKCGSTDIFSRLTEHPQIMQPREKEPRWFDIRRYAKGQYTFDWYVSNFEDAAREISQELKTSGFSRRIVGDGSPTYFWRNYHWGIYLGNKGCKEPLVLNSDFIHHLVPHAKFIISFRNPVDSLYSKYLSYGDKGLSRSPDHFHALVVKQLHRYRECFSQSSVRSCAYNVTMSMGTEVRLEKGLYAIFLADWFRLFPKDQFHIIRFEDYISNVQVHLHNMFEFLELDAMPDTSLRQLAARPPANKGSHYHTGLMLPSTRQLLLEFYTPFNERLARLLADKRFLWPP